MQQQLIVQMTPMSPAVPGFETTQQFEIPVTTQIQPETDRLTQNSPLPEVNWERYRRAIDHAETVRPTGRVVGLVGLTVEADGPSEHVGEFCYLEEMKSRRRVPAEVIGFRQGRVLLMPLGESHGIGPGWIVSATGQSLSVSVGQQMLGRVVDALGNPIDGKGPVPDTVQRSLSGKAA